MKLQFKIVLLGEIRGGFQNGLYDFGPFHCVLLKKRGLIKSFKNMTSEELQKELDLWSVEKRR